MDYEVFFISAILRASCNEIESSIINRGMCLVAARVNKGENKYTEWENSRDRYECMLLNILKNIY